MIFLNGGEEFEHHVKKECRAITLKLVICVDKDIKLKIKLEVGCRFLINNAISVYLAKFYQKRENNKNQQCLVNL